jgi:protein-tyrosine-phosphatase
MSAPEKNVLAICEHNVGRSQMLRAFLEWLNIKSSSAGTDPLFDQYQGPGEAVVASLQELDISTDGYGIQRVTPEMVEAATHVIALCSPSLLPAYIFDSPKTEVYELPDPRFVFDLDSMSLIRDMVGCIAYSLAEDVLKEVDSHDENASTQQDT